MFKFSLYTDDLGLGIIQAPVNWDDIKPALIRNETYKSIFRVTSFDINFDRDGYDYIRNFIDNYNGINKECKLYVDEYDPNEFKYVNRITAILDTSTYGANNSEGNIVKFSIVDSWILNTLKQREDVEVDLNALNSFNDELLPVPAWKVIELPAEDLYKNEKGEIAKFSYGFGNAAEDYWLGIVGVTGNWDFNETKCQIINTTLPNFDDNYYWDFHPETDVMTRIHGYIEWGAFLRYADVTSVTLHISHIADSGNVYYDIATQEININNQTVNKRLEFDRDIMLRADTKYNRILAWFNIAGSSPNDSAIYIYSGRIDIGKPTQVPFTMASCYELNDAVDKVLRYITDNQITLNSSTIPYGENMLLNGRLLRNIGYDKAECKISFRDLITSIMNVYNKFIAIDYNANTADIIDVEDLYKDEVILTIDSDTIEADTFNRTIADDEYHALELKIGSDSSHIDIDNSDYELPDYHYDAKHMCNVKFNDGYYNIKSNVRLDYIGIMNAKYEYSNDPDEVSNNLEADRSVFLINSKLKAGSGYVYQPVGKEDFDTINNLIPDVNVPYNLNLTPVRCLINHRRTIMSLLGNNNKYKFIDADIKCNLETKRNDESYLVKECKDFVISDYDDNDSPLFSGYFIEFFAPITYDDFNSLVANTNKLIRFVDPNDNKVRDGWILEVSMGVVDKFTNFKLLEKNPQLNA